MRYLSTFLTIFFSVIFPALTVADNWQVDYPQSKLEFIAIQEGSPMRGSFKHYRADINFDPQRLSKSRFQVWVETSSVDTGADERDQILRSAEFFDSTRWPQAEFKTTSISHLQGTRYQALALLSIRNIEKPLLFPFSLEIIKEPHQSRLMGNGQISINRFDFDMAQGDWADTSLLGKTITIEVTIQDTRASTVEATQ